MRKFLLFIGWASVIGSIADGAISAFALWLVSQGEAALSITVDALLRAHLSFIYWVKALAYAIMPDGFVAWMFGLPALIYFPVRVVTSVLLGGWLLHIAGRMGDRRAASAQVP